jgi:hypothetical protein
MSVKDPLTSTVADTLLPTMVTVRAVEELLASGTAHIATASGKWLTTGAAALPVMFTRPEITAPLPERPLGPVADIELPHAAVEAASATTRTHCRARTGVVIAFSLARERERVSKKRSRGGQREA